ncbi:hypothetical protein IAU60_006876 [Kwoniella sp. DSM 27419]
MSICESAWARLLPVHDVIFDYFAEAAPATYVRLSKWHYDDGVAALYHTFPVNDKSLYGLTLPAPDHQRTLRALEYAEVLHFDNEPSGISRATQGVGPYPCGYQKLFPNVKSLHVRGEALVNQVPFDLNGYGPILPLQNALWFHVRRPLQEVILDLRMETSINIRARQAGLERLRRSLSKAFLSEGGEAKIIDG